MSMVMLKRSDGAKFRYGDVYRILSYGLTGVGTLAVEIFTEPNAQGDGDMVTGERVPMREIQIEAVCVSRAANKIARGIANRFFNPQYTYEVHLDYKGQKAWIPCHLESFDLPTENVHKPQALKVSFLCPDPYFLSESSYGKNIAQVVAGAGFPYMEHPTYGWIASYYDFSRSVIIENNGDVASHPTIEITARGHVANPTITKDDAFVRVLDSMESGDQILIDFDAKAVRKNGVNIIQKLSKDSSLLSISFNVGPNLVSYSADEGENVMSCYVYFYERYVGV